MGLRVVCSHLRLNPFDQNGAPKQAYESIIFPRLKEFKPELLIISAGFDAHSCDPLANINLEAEDFYWVTKG